MHTNIKLAVVISDPPYSYPEPDLLTILITIIIIIIIVKNNNNKGRRSHVNTRYIPNHTHRSNNDSNMYSQIFIFYTLFIHYIYMYIKKNITTLPFKCPAYFCVLNFRTRVKHMFKLKFLSTFLYVDTYICMYLKCAHVWMEKSWENRYRNKMCS